MKKEYYIQGDPARANEIKAAFEKEGCTLYRLASNCDSEDLIYYSLNGIVRGIKKDNLYLFEAHPGYKELELPTTPKFNVGDWIVRSNGSSDIPIQVYGIKRGRYLVTNMLGSKGELMINRQDEWHLWTIEDAIDGDVLALNGKPFIYSSHKYGKNYCYIDDCGQFRANFNLVFEGNCVCPATKQERDLLFSKMREVGYEWDSKNKELRKIIKPKFNVGDKVIYKGKVRTITRIVEGYYEFDGWAASCRIEKQDELLSAAPNFKVGDWVVTDYGKVSQVVSVDKDGDGYTLDDGVYFSGSWCDMYHRWTIQDVKDGDILSAKIDGDDYILIFKLIKDGWIETYGHYYITIDKFCTPTQMFCRDYQGKLYPATKEQRERLFAKLREEGYTWDEEKKELKRSIKPKFKLHDIIMRGSNLYGMRTIMHVNNEKMTYGLSYGKDIPFSEQDLWHLANSHYFINNFKPFQKVLVRQEDDCPWRCDFYSHKEKAWFFTPTSCYRQCIPFEGNEKLVGTTKPCAQEYVNW